MLPVYEMEDCGAVDVSHEATACGMVVNVMYFSINNETVLSRSHDLPNALLYGVKMFFSLSKTECESANDSSYSVLFHGFNS